jgi:hypothetical protein
VLRQEVRRRLAKFVGLLGSDHDGEVVQAAHAIRRLLIAQGKSLPDLMQVVAGEGQDVNSPAWEYMSMADDILANSASLKLHEQDFVRNMRAKFQTNSQFQMSEKQAKWFRDLFARHGEAA